VADFTLAVDVESRGIDLARLRFWDDTAMADLCAWSQMTILVRTVEKGVSADGSAFKGYSTRPIYVSTAKARLAPKGGNLSRTGKSMRFDGGYREYKKKSRGAGESVNGVKPNAEVDLILSGELMRAVNTTTATAEKGIVSLTGAPKEYGTHVNKARPFLGHHKGESAAMDKELNAIVDRAIARALGSGGGGSSPAFG
jgi:hypothetical protein